MIAATAGIVLAGGRSTRFGSDKLAIEHDGRPLLHFAIEAVAAVCDEVIVVASPTGLPPLPAGLAVPLRVCRDEVADQGPLGGLVAGLRATTADQIMLVGGDMPALVPALLADLLGRLGPDVDGAALLESDRLRPLPCAMVRTAAFLAAAELRPDRTRLRDVLAAIRTFGVPESDWRRLDPAGSSLLDIDRPEDLARLKDSASG